MWPERRQPVVEEVDEIQLIDHDHETSDVRGDQDRDAETEARWPTTATEAEPDTLSRLKGPATPADSPPMHVDPPAVESSPEPSWGRAGRLRSLLDGVALIFAFGRPAERVMATEEAFREATLEVARATWIVSRRR